MENCCQYSRFLASGESLYQRLDWLVSLVGKVGVGKDCNILGSKLKL